MELVRVEGGRPKCTEMLSVILVEVLVLICVVCIGCTVACGVSSGVD